MRKERAQIHFLSDVHCRRVSSLMIIPARKTCQNAGEFSWEWIVRYHNQVWNDGEKYFLICLRPALTPHQEFHIVAQRRTVKECTKKCDSRAELLVVYHLQKVPGKSSRKVNGTRFFCSLPGATERLKRKSWALSIPPKRPVWIFGNFK